MNWFESLACGVVQGITEFLPVSSSGHLILLAKLFERFTGVLHGEEENLFFFVMLHVGTLAAIAVHYRKEALAGAKGLVGRTDVAEPYRRAGVARVALLVGLATAWLVVDKLVFLKWMKMAYGNPTAIGVGFWITAGALAVTASRLSGGDKGPADTTILDALIVGLAQAVAPLPGVSRSGMTVAAALAVGFRRAWAVQFSLMLAVPAILGAAVFEIKDVDRSTLTPERISQTLAATVVAGLVGYGAIVWLLRVVQKGHLWYFSVYLAVLGLVVIVGFGMSGASLVEPKLSTPERPARARPPERDDRGLPGGREGAVAGPVGPGPRPSGS